MLTKSGHLAIAPMPNINNAFRATSDTLSPNLDSLPTKFILIDADPANARLIDSLKTDRIRAVAWQGGAGTVLYGEHRTRQPRYNHYWNDTHTPCENQSGYDTGIMQIVRRGITWPGWEPYFRAAHSEIPGYVSLGWDSLAWNWQVCIDNGIFIHNTYGRAKLKPEQLEFPDSCSLADCDTFPKSKNIQDLLSYGYHCGVTDMRKILNNSDWDEKIAKKVDPPDGAKYVQNVRKFYYRKSWQ